MLVPKRARMVFLPFSGRVLRNPKSEGKSRPAGPVYQALAFGYEISVRTGWTRPAACSEIVTSTIC